MRLRALVGLIELIVFLFPWLLIVVGGFCVCIYIEIIQASKEHIKRNHAVPYKTFVVNAEFGVEFAEKAKKDYEDGYLKNKKRSFLIITFAILVIGLGIYLIINGYYSNLI